MHHVLNMVSFQVRFKIRIGGPFCPSLQMRLADHRDSNLRHTLRRRDRGDRALIFEI